MDRKESFISRSKIIHKGVYGYEYVDYKNTGTKVKIKCDLHGIFEQRPADHLRGKGCIECGFAKRAKSKTLSLTQFLDKVKEVHGDKYDLSKIKYNGMKNHVTLICKEHGEFTQPAVTLVRGADCNKCVRSEYGLTIRLNNHSFIEKAKMIHGSKYDYSVVEYKLSNKSVQIICKKHGIFSQRPNDHLNGHGCRKCSIGQSEKEKNWLDDLQIPILYRQYSIRLDSSTVLVDGYDPSTNTVYEFYGDYWHGNPEVYNSDEINRSTNTTFGDLYKNTLKREDSLKKCGYNLITIWEKDYNEPIN